MWLLGLGRANEGGCGFVKLDTDEVRERERERDGKWNQENIGGALYFLNKRLQICWDQADLWVSELIVAFLMEVNKILMGWNGPEQASPSMLQKKSFQMEVSLWDQASLWVSNKGIVFRKFEELGASPLELYFVLCSPQKYIKVSFDELLEMLLQI